MICTLYFSLFFSDGDTESSGFQWNAESIVFLFVEAADSSGFQGEISNHLHSNNK
jgi:hypothetical protein